MGTQGTGRKRSTKKERSTAEDDALNLIAREAEARLAAKRAARAEAREIRMRELERQQKEIFQVQKKYYGLDTRLDDRGDSKWGDIEQWMEDSERYSRSSRIRTHSDDDERMSVGSRGSVRGSSSLSHKKSKKKKKHKHKDRDRNGYDDDYSVISSRSSRLSDDSRVSRASRLDLQPASYASSDLYSLNGLSCARNPGSALNGYQSSLYEDSVCSGSRRVAASTSHPLEYTSYRSSSSRASSRASSARTSPVDNCSSVASFLRSAASSSGLPRDLDDVTIPDFSDVEDRDYLEKGSRAASALTAGTLTSLGGTSSRRGSGETALTLDAETSIRELKEIHELKDQIQDVEIKYTQNLKEAKDALAEVEEKYRKAMVSNAQLDNEKNNLMYQVDTLKDSLMELEEMLSESQRGYEEKVKELEREKHAHSVLQFQFNEMKETLKQSEELLNEIRQLRMKQEGFVREISDLQETVEWKDKKIGALERQKEYTDAIRIERDELREEVVKLKDILKKHGIVLGPDLNINGDVGETEGDGSSSADAASQSAAGPQTPPTEGNSMLGNTEETQLTSRGEEEGDPEQHGEMFEEAKENHLSSDTICNYAGVSPLETQREELPTEEQQTCLAKEEGDVAPSGLSTDLNVDINKCSLTEAKDAVICSSELQEIVTSSEENTGEKEKPEGGDSGEFSNPDLGETENKSSSVETQSDDNRESCNNKQEDVEESHLRKSDSCPQQKVAREFSKESLPGESVPAASNTKPQQAPDNAEEAESNTKPQQAPDNAEEAENDEDTEEIQSISQPQGATASGKKKKKKRRGKKKGGAQQKDEAIKEKGKTEKKEKDNVLTTEHDIEGSVSETLKEPRVDQNEQDRPETEEVDGVEAGKPAENFSHSETLQESTLDHVTEEHDEEQTLETEKAAAVKNTETFSQNESLKEIRAGHVMAEQNEEQTLETETVEAGEAVTPTETFAVVETHEEPRRDPEKDEQEEEQSLETEKAEEVESVTGPVTDPVPEVDLSTPDLIGNSTSTENTDGLDEVCTSTVSNSEHETDISTNANVIHTDADESADEVGSHDDMKSECPTNDHENAFETSVKEDTDAESHVPSNDGIATDASESRSESKDDTSVSSTDGFTDGLKSLAGSELPSEPSTAVNSGKGPEEASETIKDGEEPETEQESFPAIDISVSHDGDNSELKPDRTENGEQSEDLREPEGLVEPDSCSHEEKSDSCDSASLTEDTDAFDAEKSVETVAQAKQDDAESQTSQCEDHIDESAAEVASETEEVLTIDMLNTDSPAESTETGCCIALHHSTEESAAADDPELKNTQNDLPSETHLCPLEEQSHESREPNEDNSDSSQPRLQDSDEEDGEDEGQSFDFDDMDMDVASAPSVPENLAQEEVDEGVEVMSDESQHGSSGLCQSNTESNENTQGERAESSDRKCDDGGNQADTVDPESDTSTLVEAMSENMCEKQISTAVEEIVVANEPITVEEKVSIAGELGVVAENIHQAESSPIEEGLDAIKQEFQGEALVLPKSADQVAGNNEPPQTRKDVKKNTKKGKAKGKEECKMS